MDTYEDTGKELTKDEKIFKLIELFSQLSEEQQEFVLKEALTFQEG